MNKKINKYNEEMQGFKTKINNLGFEINEVNSQGFKEVKYNDMIVQAGSYDRLYNRLDYVINQNNKLNEEMNALKVYPEIMKPISDTVHFEEMGMRLKEINNLSCRIRTVSRDVFNNIYFIELGTTIPTIKSEKRYISVRFIFRADNWNDLNSNTSKDLNHIIEYYRFNKVEYNEENIIKLLNNLGMNVNKISFDSGYKHYNQELHNQGKIFKYNVSN